MKDRRDEPEDNKRRCLTDEERREIIQEAAKIAAEYALDTLIPERVYDMCMEHFERQVGRSVIRKGLWAVGLAVTAIGGLITAWAKGWLRIP